MRNKENAEKDVVLIATADDTMATALGGQLEVDGHDHERCADAQCVLRMVGRRHFAVIVLDLDLVNEGGDVHLVSYIRGQRPNCPIILLFDESNVEKAMEGVRQGAYFYLPSSCAASDVALIVNKAMKHLQTEAALELYEQNVFREFMGESPAMKRVAELISKVAPTDSTVLLLGESGTGKEVMANTIHRLSDRSDMPFVAINCAALPEALLESEMFGHVKGAFTGASVNKDGLFEKADGGTIFLDEVGDMPLSIQAKLLRALQNGEVRRVGDTQSKWVDVRVIAATNSDLVEAVQEKRFREDLYFRLNVIQIQIPPLRERMDALNRLIGLFIRRFTEKYGKNVHMIDERAETHLRSYDYPGNVRELESIIAHAVILSDDGVIREKDLPDHVRGIGDQRLALPRPNDGDIRPLTEVEEQHIRHALDALGGNQTEAAKKLGISRSTLWRKMKEYNIPSQS